MPTRTILLLVGLSFHYIPMAQVITNHNNKILIDDKGIHKKEYRKPVFDLPTPDTTAIWKKDSLYSKNEFVKPFRFAEPISVRINLLSEASWITDGDTAYGKFTLRVKKAKSLSINFSPFQLPPGTEMFIYNAKGNMITGPVTEMENNKDRWWGSAIYKGDELTIELSLPVRNKESLQLSISNIAFGYKPIFQENSHGFGASSSCTVNAICPVGDGWDRERSSVGLILGAAGHSLCSGSLINNLCQENIPYFLTAKHCEDYENAYLQQWTFIFQYYSRTCDPGEEPYYSVIYNGASLRSESGNTDFALLELYQRPGALSNLYFAGWNRSPQSAQNGTSLHHPKGDVMKISRDNDPLVQSGTVFDVTGMHWQTRWEYGFVQGGSSGGPLFDENHRLIGQLEGSNSICGNQSAFYGRFDLSWNGEGTSGTRLRDWLDPANTGAMTSDAQHPLGMYRPLEFAINGNDNLCSGSTTYFLSGVFPTANVVWSSSAPNIASIQVNAPNNNSITVTRQGTGEAKLRATITSACGRVYNVTKSIHLGPSLAGYYTISSNYHNPGTQYPLGSNNSFFLPANQSAGVTFHLTNPGLQFLSWSKSGYPVYWNTFNQSKSVSFSITAAPTAYSSRTTSFDASAQTNCGFANQLFNFTVVTQGWSGYRIAASPNPAKDRLQVSIDEESPEVTALRKEKTVVIELLDVSTTLVVKQWKFRNLHKNFILDISSMKKGNYMLTVRIGNYKETKQVLITD